VVSHPRFFYGWYLVALMIISMMLVYGVRNAFPVFFDPVLDEFQWYRGSTAIMLSLNILVYGLAAPVAGSLVDRWKSRKVVFIGIIVLTLATFACAFAQELWHFYLLFGIIVPIGTAFCGSPILNPALMNWFGKKRVLAISLGQIGGGLSFAYSIIIEVVISYWGWRLSFYVMAGILLAVLLPLYFIFFYYRPEDKKMEAYGIEKSGDEISAGEVEILTRRDWTFGNAIKTSHIWLLVFSQICYWGIGNYLVIAHQIKFAVDVGFSSVLAASVFALFGVTSIVGQLCASISDKIGREKTAIAGVVMAMGAMVALLSVATNTQSWLLYTYAIVSGFATGIFSPTIFVSVADIFHGRNVGAISSLILTGTGIGGAIGPWLGGFIFDIYGSYRIAFIISLVSYAAAGLLFWLAAPRHAIRIRDRLSDISGL
jgi:MFS family permease